MIRQMGGIGHAIKKVVSAPFKAVGKVVNTVLGGGGSQTVTVDAPDVTGAQLAAQTQAAAPEAPVLGGENTTLDKKKKKRGKGRLLISKDSSGGSSSGGGGSYSGLNI